MNTWNDAVPAGRRRRRSARPAAPAVSFLLAVGLLLAGCSDSDPSTPPDPVRVTVTPPTATVGAGGTQVFTAAVTGSSNNSVTWSASGGSLQSSGTQATLTAPVDGGTVTVTATSQADASASGSASVTVTPVQLALSPSEGEVFRGGTLAFTVTVSGTDSRGVEWDSGCGTLDVDGSSATLQAPSDEAGPCDVTVRSTLNPAVTTSAPVMVRPDWVVTEDGDGMSGSCTPGGACTLRDALAAVQAGDGPVGSDGRAAIRFSHELAGSKVTLTSELPAIRTDVVIQGPTEGTVTVDAGASQTDPRRVFLFSDGVSAEVHGLRLTGGVAPQGGGVAVEGGSSVRFVDSEIADNRGIQSSTTAGGLLVTEMSTVRLENTRVVGNRTIGTGGRPGAGMSVVAGSTLEMEGGSIEGNETEAGWGGGLRVFDGSEASLTGVRVAGNRAMGELGGGGGIWAGNESHLVLEDVVVEGNETDWDGGGIRVVSGSEAVIRNVQVMDNRAPAGAGISVGSEDTRVELTDVLVAGNVATSRAAGYFGWSGSQATLTRVELRANRAGTGGGGGIYLQQASGIEAEDLLLLENRSEGGQSRGGGASLLSGSRMSAIGVEIRDNVTEGMGGGGGVYLVTSTLILEDGEVTGNRSEQGAGGGVAAWTDSRIEVRRVRLEGNETQGAGGGIFTGIGTEGALEDLEFHDNSARLNGGALQMISGAQVEAIRVRAEGNRAESSGGAIGLFQTARLRLVDAVVVGNRSETSAGGMMASLMEGGELEMDRVEFRDNEAGVSSGGLAVIGSGEASLRRLTVVGNRAGNAVGGMQLVIPGSLLTDSGILDNVAEEGWGGGMVLGAGAEVRNTTISGNRANRAGAVHLGFGGGTMNGVTVVGNTAETNGAGIRFFDPAQAVLTNVLMAGNLLEDGTATNCFFDQQVPPASRGHNLSDDDSCAPVLTQQGDLSGVEAGVDPDPDHEAGPTPFHPLLEGSAAIGAGHPDRCLATDQRGFGRGAPCDIGAIEFGGTAPGAMRTEVAPGSWFVVRPGSAGRSMTPQGAAGGFGAADAVAPVSER